MAVGAGESEPVPALLTPALLPELGIAEGLDENRADPPVQDASQLDRVVA